MDKWCGLWILACIIAIVLHLYIYTNDFTNEGKIYITVFIPIWVWLAYLYMPKNCPR